MKTATDDLVLTAVEDGLLTITLNRPEKRNALSLGLFDAVGEAFDRAAEPDVRVVLLRGEGRVFCAGIDLSSLAVLGGADVRVDFLSGVAHLQEIHMKLERIGKPSVCAVHGVAFGAGLQLATACDLRVAADDARLGLLEIRHGIIPDLTGIHRVVQLCGPSRAKDIAMTGRELGADEALRIGLVDRVVAAAEVQATALELARAIAANAPLATSWIKRLADQAAAGQHPDENLRDVAAAQLECITSPDFSEAFTARMEGRPPAFTGQRA
ncbi:MAG TPA: enoyl-CoA hydratase/isomerase family protein [Candidatus Dormibacteraeota bacterium]|nr:enoyl-CoA hydratase/isomerase family protein [Candidatus Dormibacteraeota bacterium]